MDIKELMTNYTRFNLWANETIADWLRTKPEAALYQKVPSSYPSIAETIMHIWDTERFWIRILQGEQPTDFGQNFDGDVSELFADFLKQSAHFAEHVKAMGQEEITELCLLDQPWMKGSLPKYEYIQHCMNHGTYHRGQVITIGRNVGLTDAPTTDYNYYNMLVKNGLTLI